MIEELVHARVRLALHRLRDGEGTALLFLHGLGERSPQRLDRRYDAWPGPVAALDFTGHGASTVPSGGGYTAEILMADADVALGRLGCATVVGRGLGGYVALMLAGARPEQVRGAIILDGPGLAGGGTGTTSPFVPVVDRTALAPPDPFALADLATDIRPPDYASLYARLASQFSQLARPVSVCARERASWLQAVTAEAGVEETTLEEALAYYARRR
ncbi:MAG: alpha/beta hydrolase [Myxococcales bacterium]|nr:alpha/beta hydrolase [Myxococcales bacterium]